MSEIKTLVSEATVRRRMSQGWSEERARTTPPMSHQARGRKSKRKGPWHAYQRQMVEERLAKKRRSE